MGLELLLIIAMSISGAVGWGVQQNQILQLEYHTENLKEDLYFQDYRAGSAFCNMEYELCSIRRGGSETGPEAQCADRLADCVLAARSAWCNVSARCNKELIPGESAGIYERTRGRMEK